MKQNLELLAALLALIAIPYIAIAGIAWEWRNPTANKMTFWTEFPSVVTFKKLPKYQGQP
jgi:hypothetical protein